VVSTSAEATSSSPRTFVGLRIASLAVAALFAVPFVYLVVENLTAGDSPLSFLTAEGLGPLLRSVVLAVAVAAAATTLGTAAAWLVARTDLPGKRLWRVLLPLPLVIPSFIGAFIMISTFAPGGLLETILSPLGIEGIPAIRGFIGSFLVLTLFTYPYVYLPVAARFRQLPSSLEESSRLLGSGGWPTFFRVVLPQARGAVLAGSLLVFLYTISDFGVVQLMRYDALTRVIYATRLFDRTTSIALTLQLGLLALLVVATERVITARPTQARIARPAGSLTVRLGRYRPLSLTFVAGLVGAALAIPVGVLIFWAVRGLVQGSTSGVLVTGSIFRAVFNTAFASVSAAIVAVVVVLPIAYLTVRHRSRIGGVSNAVVVGGFALPGLAIALSMVYLTVSRPLLSPLYQTLLLLVAAYVIHFGAQALRASQVALSGVPTSLEDAAQVLGVHRWQRFARIELPLMRPGLLAGAGLVLLNAMKELPATLLLAPAGFQTLAMKIWQASESAFFSDAAIAALILIALSGVLTWLLVIRRAEGTS
jgi:iron(III) transport system permease protein